MINLTAEYMGLTLKSPVLVAASTLSADLTRIRQAEAAGAGAVVLRSLFEEQTDPEELPGFLDPASRVVSPLAPPATRTVLPGPDAYMEWAKRVRETVSIPVIASINACHPGSWGGIARRLEGTGVDGIELNIYRVPTNPLESAAIIEEGLLAIIRRVRGEISIPLAVKLSPFYTAPAHLAQRVADAGADALVLFNRFLQPDIDVDAEEVVSELQYSSQSEMRLPLRWIALLHGRIEIDLALTTGVHSGHDVVKALLAGATVVQVASILYRCGMDFLRDMNAGVHNWMVSKGYSSLDEFRGKLSQQSRSGSRDLERAHYVKLMLAQT